MELVKLALDRQEEQGEEQEKRIVRTVWQYLLMLPTSPYLSIHTVHDTFHVHVHLCVCHQLISKTRQAFNEWVNAKHTFVKVWEFNDHL